MLRAHLTEFDLVGVAGTTRVVAGKWAAAGDPYVFTLISSPDPERGGWATALLGGAAISVGGIQALDGVFLAAKREAALAVGFDARTFDGFHLYDLDFSFRAFCQGFRLAVCRDIVLIHESTGSYDRGWDEYRLRFEAKHRQSLAPLTPALAGARAYFSSRSKDEVRSSCDPARIARVIAQIDDANSRLALPP